MRLSKILSVFTVFSMVFTMVAIFPSGLEEPEDYVLTTSGQTMGGEVIEISFTNNTDYAVVLSQTIDVKVGVDGHYWFAQWERESLSTDKGDVIFGGAASMEVLPNETEVFAIIAPGNGYDWRSFHTAYYDMLIEVWLAVDGIDYHFSAIQHEVLPQNLNLDVEFSTNGPLEYYDGINEGIIISMTNNSNEDITIAGPVIINPDSTPMGYREEYELIGGSSMTVPAGETVEIVEIPSGPPMSWRNFYFPQIKELIAFVAIDTDEGLFIWQSEELKFCITGDMYYQGWDPIFEETWDNGDGSAAIVINIHGTVDEWGVILGNDGCEWYQEEKVILDPVTGLSKDYFTGFDVLPGGGQQIKGKILNVYESEAGKYEITWSYDDGTHDVVFEVVTPDYAEDEDYFHSIVNKDPNGWDPNIQVLISTQNRPVENVIDTDTGKYTGVLEYSNSKITFVADEEINVEINYRRKGETLLEIPQNINPAGIYFDINLASGSLPDSIEIHLEIDYTRDDIPEGMNEENLRIYRFNEETSEWDLLPNQTVDTVNKIIKVVLTEFSEFGVFEASEDDLITPTPTPTPVEDEESDDDYTDEMGDNNHSMLLGVLMLITIASVGLIFKKSRS